MGDSPEDIELPRPAGQRSPGYEGHRTPTPKSILRNVVSVTSPEGSSGGSPASRSLTPSQTAPAVQLEGASTSPKAASLRPRVGMLIDATSRLRAQQQGREARALRDAFERFDEDGSNSIDVDELGNLMQYLGYRLARSDLQSLVSQVATDGRTELTFAETEQLTQMYRSAAQFKLVAADSSELQERAAVSDLIEGARFDEAEVAMMDMSAGGSVFRPAGPPPSKPLLPSRPSDHPAIGFWEAAMLAVATYLWISALIVAAFDDSEALEWMDANVGIHCVAFLVLIADLVVRWRVIIADHTAAWYTVRAFDIIAALPLDIIGYAVAKTDPTAANVTVMRVLVFFKVLKNAPTWFYFEQSGLALVNRRYIALYAYVFPACEVFFNMVRITHVLSVIWFVTSDEPQMEGSFVKALYFTSYTITGVGYGTVEPVNDTQRLIAAAYCLVAQAIIAYVVGSIVAVIAESDVKGDGEHQVVQTLRVAKIAGVGHQLRDDSANFQDHLVRNKLADAYGDLTSNLPKQLRDNITLFVKVRLIANDSVFSLAHRATQVALAQVLESAIHRPGEALYLAGDVLQDMLFVAHGTVQVVSRGGATSTVHRAGSHLGEGALLFGSEETIDTARCLTHCEIFTLRRKAFRDIRSKFPVFDIEMNRISQFIQEKFEEQAELLRQAQDEHAAAEAEREAAVTVVTVPAERRNEDKESGDDGGSNDGNRSAHNVLTVVSADHDDANRDGTTPRQSSQAPKPTRAPSGTSAASPARSSGTGLTPGKTVDFHFKTTTGAVVDLNRISATFRVAAANPVVSASFRNASVRGSSPGSTSPLNKEERLAALATDSIFGRLEGGTAIAEEVDLDDDDDDDDDDEDSNAEGSGSDEGSGSEGHADENATIDECEAELVRIEALLTRLSARPSASLLSADGKPAAGKTGGTPHLSPRGSGRSSTGALSLAIADPSDVFEREEGEASGAPPVPSPQL